MVTTDKPTIAPQETAILPPASSPAPSPPNGGFAAWVLETSTDMSFYLVSILNAGSAVGRLGSALLTQRLGAGLILSVSVTTSAALILGWIGVKTQAYFITFCVLFGISSGALISANPLVIAHPVVSPTPAMIGTRMGMLWFTASLGVLIGAPIAGAIEGHGGGNGYLGLQVFSGVVMAGGGIFLMVPLLAIWRYDRQKGLE
ncbi:hypothetical protein APSETT444_008582 [Aspergillus pseudonomiae]